MTTLVTERPWEKLSDVIRSRDTERIGALLHELSPAETARAISRISPEEQGQLLTLLEPAEAAEVVAEVSQTQAVELIEKMAPSEAAMVVEELSTDRQADVIAGMDTSEAEAILEGLPAENAEEVRMLMNYPENSAGGIMNTEYLVYSEFLRVSELIDDLHAKAEQYADYNIQYIYVINEDGQLTGVLRIRDLLFVSRNTALENVMIREPQKVHVLATLDQLEQFFAQHRLFGIPVVDDDDCLVGVVRRAAVEEAKAKRTSRQLLRLGGIVGGEEFRSMPLLSRSGRRLSWLSINIVLNMISASVIALFQDTLQAAIALAVFLPIISDMSGCSGNQSVAVSMRELTLGLIRPNEFLRILAKDIGLALINGIALGTILACVAFMWKGNLYLSLVVGSALCLNNITAVMIGGMLPLLIKWIRLDPAMVSGPILTTITDMFGFFLTLGFATLMLSRLAT
ncbi:MAG: magnesium transporter [Planctomycetota bacterium]|jgi:magnesium transporter